jgi:hypothetical protein
VLGPVAGRVQAAEYDRPDRDLIAVRHRVVRELSAGTGVDADRDPMLEREPAVARKVIRVRVRLDRAHDAYAAPLGLLEVLLDCERRIDDHGLARRLVADEIGRTSERVVDELREDHSASERSTGGRYFS